MKKWRRRYQYKCKTCGKQRFTLNWNRKIDEECTICQRNKPNENQRSLFDIEKSAEIIKEKMTQEEEKAEEKKQILELIDKNL